MSAYSGDSSFSCGMRHLPLAADLGHRCGRPRSNGPAIAWRDAGRGPRRVDHGQQRIDARLRAELRVDRELPRQERDAEAAPPQPRRRLLLEVRPAADGAGHERVADRAAGQRQRVAPPPPTRADTPLAQLEHDLVRLAVAAAPAQPPAGRGARLRDGARDARSVTPAARAGPRSWKRLRRSVDVRQILRVIVAIFAVAALAGGGAVAFADHGPGGGSASSGSESSGSGSGERQRRPSRGRRRQRPPRRRRRQRRQARGRARTATTTSATTTARTTARSTSTRCPSPSTATPRASPSTSAAASSSSRPRATARSTAASSATSPRRWRSSSRARPASRPRA